MALFQKKAGGTKVGNLIRTVTQSNLGKAAISVANPYAGLAVAPLKKPSPMVFPVGAGLTGNQQVAAYKVVAPKSVMATGIQSVKPKSTGVNYTPVPGGPLAYTPIPGGKLDYSNNKNTQSDVVTSDTGVYNAPTSKKSIITSSSTNSVGTPSAKISSPTTTYTSPTSGTSTQATAGDLVTGANSFDYNLTPEQRAYEEAIQRQRDYADQQSNQGLNRDSIMQDTLAQFQGEIDATNQIYAQKLAEAKAQGQGRIGTTRAENFNSGAVDSSFGNAAQERTQLYNTGIENSVQAEKLKTLSEIEGKARELGNKYYEDKKAAKEAGLESYISSIKSAKDAKDAISNNIADSLINSNISPDEVTGIQLEKIAKNAGVSVPQIKLAYSTKQAEAAAAEAKLAFNLSEGQARYDSKGNIIASRAKTYKDSGTGSGGTSSVSPQAQALADQMIKGKLQWTNVPAALKGQVAIAMNESTGSQLSPVLNNIKEAKSVIDDLLSSTGHGLAGATGTLRLGAQVGGTQASDFRAKIDRVNSLLFLNAVPQMKGMGALTEREGAKLESSASTIGNYKQKEGTYKSELVRLQKQLADSYKALGGDVVASNSADSSTIDTSTISQSEAQQLVDEGYATSLEDAYTQLNG